MSNCNPHLFGGDHHCGSCGRSAEDIVTKLEAEIKALKDSLNRFVQCPQCGNKTVFTYIRSRLALDELLEERQEMELRPGALWGKSDE